MDSATGLTILGAAIGSAKVVEKVFGPTAEYLGGSIKEFTQRRVANISNIIKIAADRLGDRIDSPGQIPPKVLKALLDDGGFCDDPLAAEYFGGVLASSRSEVSRDDRGAYLLNIVNRLSSYQVRAHYIFYSVIRATHLNKPCHLGIHQTIRDVSVLMPFSSFLFAMDFGHGEKTRPIMAHLLAGLSKETLIGDLDGLSDKRFREFTNDGLVIIPTLFGIELFLSAHGLANEPIDKWLSDKHKLKLLAEISFPQGSPIDLTILAHVQAI